MKSILDFAKAKSEGKPISMVTCYDYSFANIVKDSSIDCVLVGDSLGNTMHGFADTIPVDVAMMELHIRAVKRGIGDKFLVGDMPFLAHKIDDSTTMRNIEKIMKAGANCVKIEGIDGNENIFRKITDAGIPIMGHLGLTPQSVNQFGGFKIQGKDELSAKKIVDQAKKVEDSGCFALVVECVPEDLGKTITESINIPTIGIGAGKYTSGQVLVLQDMLGMNNLFKAKFVKQYIDGYGIIKDALNEYDFEVKSGKFPEKKHSY
jgi:3-methyl-2-oxobutanoate hydroxymethyltransferase